MDRGNGEFQDGSFRELKILKEESREALEQLSINCLLALFGTSQHLNKKAFSLDPFCLVIIP